MTDKMRSADVHAEIFVTPATNGSFAKEQTMAKIGATTEMRTKLTFSRNHKMGFGQFGKSFLGAVLFEIEQRTIQ